MAQREAQTAFFAGDNPEAVGFEDSPYRLHSKNLNLSPAIREHGIKYFGDHGIVWHTHANHGLSSQVCCLNFLMPLADKPELLAAFVGHVLDIAPPEMLAIDETNGSLVGFEWVGKESYLNETRGSARLGRGAHATSADAIVRFRHEGRVEALLIEWKYTESYGAPLDPDGNETRVKRYKDIAIAPDGPIRNDIGLVVEDFFWEPFYQLLRQQMLAFQMQKHRESGVERVRVLHIAPAANKALLKITAPKLRGRGADTAFAAFQTTLVDPTAFVSVATEQAFAPLLVDPRASEWASYIRQRYTFVGQPAA